MWDTGTLAYCINVLSVFPWVSVSLYCTFYISNPPKHACFFFLRLLTLLFFSLSDFSFKSWARPTSIHRTSVCFSSRGKYWFAQHSSFFIAIALLPKVDRIVRWILLVDLWSWPCPLTMSGVCLCISKHVFTLPQMGIRTYLTYLNFFENWPPPFKQNLNPSLA